MRDAYVGEDFITQHVEACGRTDVPPILHEWAAVSMLAALVQDRVGVCISDHRGPLRLCQYIVLISASGAGKGQAVEFAMNLLHDAFIDGETLDYQPVFRGGKAEAAINERLFKGLHLYAGTLTRGGLQDLLGTQVDPQTEKVAGLSPVKGHAKLYWIAEEMSYSFGVKALASELLRLLVGQKEKQRTTQQTKIRKEKLHLTIKDPCINLLACTTWAWLGSVLSGTDAVAGMLRRTHFVDVPYDYTGQRIEEEFPADVRVRREALMARIRVYAGLEVPHGRIGWRQSAFTRYKAWFEEMRNAVPEDEQALVVYGNRKTEVPKLAALSALSRWDYRDSEGLPMITVADVERGVRWWTMGYETAPKLSIQTSENPAVKEAAQVAAVLKRVTGEQVGAKVWEDKLAEVLGASGMVKRGIEEAIGTLVQRGWCRRVFHLEQRRYQVEWLKPKEGGV